ncbi:rCG37068 [Rattus norvegicus]|uniref:RCG37068 n=1 Tax=Rattus norvegicus TaxID=10116 RepID=A6HTR2_RAT|nr:rCG37068 [Rattus norvegicus]
MPVCSYITPPHTRSSRMEESPLGIMWIGHFLPPFNCELPRHCGLDH